MKYIDYHKMKEFYTIAEVCHLFEMDKKELRYYSEKYGISPQEDQYGNWGFRKVLVRKLHNYIYKEQKNSKFSSAPYCSFYVSPREMYMLLLNLVIFLCHLRKCRNIFLYGMECPRFITVNITPICVQNRLPRKRFRLLFIMPTRKHKGRRTTITDGSPAVWGKKKVSNAAHDVVSQEVCARGAGIKTAV